MRNRWIYGTALVLCWGVMWLRLASAWRLSPDLSFGWAVGGVMLAWMYERWTSLPTPAPTYRLSAEGMAAPLTLTLVITRLVLTPYPLWTTVLYLYCILAGALIFLVLYRSGGVCWVRHFRGAVWFVAAAVPWPGLVENAFVQPMRRVLAAGAAEVLNAAGIPAQSFGAQVRLGAQWVQVDAACSGVRSLHFAVATALVAGEIARLGLVRRVWLLLVAIHLALLLNLARILVLCWKVAETGTLGAGWHDATGYVAQVLILGVVAAMAWRWRTAAPSRSSAPAAPSRVSRGVRLAVGIAVVFIASELVNTWWYPLRHTNWSPQWVVEVPADAEAFRKTELSADAATMLQATQFSGGTWVDVDGTARTFFYLEWREGQNASLVPFVHNPSVCFPAAGCDLAMELPSETISLGDLSIPFRGWKFRRGDETLVAYSTVWDPDRRCLLAEAQPSAGLAGWIAQRLAVVAARRSDTRAQMLTLAWVVPDAVTPSRAELTHEVLRLIRRTPVSNRTL